MSTEPKIPGPSLFGFNLSSRIRPVSPGDIAKAMELDARQIRIWIPWNELEKGRGQFDFSELDEEIRMLFDQGFALAAVLIGAPPYACRIAETGGDFDFRACPPKLKEYEIFLKVLVSRYRARIKYWQIWNEPHKSGFWKPHPDPDDYAELLKKAYKVIKQTDPAAKVLMAGIGPVPDKNGDEIDWDGDYFPFMEYTEMVLSAMGDEAFDIMALQPVRFPKGPFDQRQITLGNGGTVKVDFKAELLQFKSLFERFGYEGKKMWITELGSPAYPLQQILTLIQKDKTLDFVETVFGSFPTPETVSQLHKKPASEE